MYVCMYVYIYIYICVYTHTYRGLTARPVFEGSDLGNWAYGHFSY